MKYEYTWLPGSLVQPAVLEELATLYSRHYGLWSATAPIKPGHPIRLSASRIRDLLASKDARLALASLDRTVVGYAIALQARVLDYGVVSWITQLVVHQDHRQNDVGKSLLFSIWGFSSHFAWGLITANPYAVRALEKATRRRCLPRRIARNQRKLMSVARQSVPYVKDHTQVEINTTVSRINTEFFVDHSQLNAMLERVITIETPWQLGNIEDGWEWFAFTFHDQQEIGLTPQEIEKMLRASDQVAMHAYSRMLLNEGHTWTRHTTDEARLVAEYCRLSVGAAILDFGCGTGRHVLALRAMGFDVTGVDYLENLIERARDDARSKHLNNVRLEVADCRHVDLGRTFDAVIALYDVIGSYADDTENVRILQNITQHLKPGGMALISVMNFDLTERKAKHFFSIAAQPDRLLALAPSNTMEQTGDVFNPDFYMIDTVTQVVYRKEQFAAGESLPVELIVRDRRYRKKDIESLCRDVGLDVVWARCIRAGAWAVPLECDNDRAKEILVLCRKPTSLISTNDLAPLMPTSS